MALRKAPLPFRPGEHLVEFHRASRFESACLDQRVAEVDFAPGDRAWVSSRQPDGGEVIWLIDGDGKKARWVGWNYGQQLPWHKIDDEGNIIEKSPDLI